MAREGGALSHRQLSFADLNGLCDHLKHVPWEYVFNLGTFAAASEFLSE